MDSVIRVEFTLGFDDFLRFQQCYTRRRLRLLRFIAIAMIFLFVIFPWLPVEFEGNPSLLHKYLSCLGALILPGIVFVLAPVNVHFAAKKRWNSTVSLREPRIYEFADAGISVTGGSFKGSSAWSNYQRDESSGPVILLFDTQTLAHLIPLNAIGDPQQLDALKLLLRRKVPDCKRL